MSRPQELAPVAHAEQLRVQILADTIVYEGWVLLADDMRLDELLNDPRPFLRLTDVVIQDRNSATTVHAPYLSLNKGAISHVVPLMDGTDEITGQSTQPASPSLSAEAAAAAAQPTVPAAGPRTLPAPPPAPRTAARHGDPPTQPFPRVPVAAAVAEGVDSIGDLILDEESDDIDPDDLERDIGAMIHGHAAAE